MAVSRPDVCEYIWIHKWGTFDYGFDAKLKSESNIYISGGGSGWNVIVLDLYLLCTVTHTV